MYMYMYVPCIHIPPIRNEINTKRFNLDGQGFALNIQSTELLHSFKTCTSPCILDENELFAGVKQMDSQSAGGNSD